MDSGDLDELPGGRKTGRCGLCARHAPCLINSISRTGYPEPDRLRRAPVGH
ncbi:MAG: hypothetical protein WCJ93_11330 [Methanomicrobiales archaeon]